MGATPQKWGTPMGWGGSGDPPLKSGGPPKKWGPLPPPEALRCPGMGGDSRNWGHVGGPQSYGDPQDMETLKAHEDPPQERGGPKGDGDPKVMETPKLWRPQSHGDPKVMETPKKT